MKTNIENKSFQVGEMCATYEKVYQKKQKNEEILTKQEIQTTQKSDTTTQHSKKDEWQELANHRYHGWWL